MNMKITPSKVTTSDDYITLVEHFSGLVYEEFRLAGADLRQGRIHEVARILPAFISLVNTIGYLRGQDGVFIEVRPQTPKYQDALYANELRFEAQLEDFIDTVLASSEASYYKDRLREYFVDARTGQGRPLV